MAGDPVTDLLDHKLSLTDVDSRGSSYLPFLEPQAAVAIIQFHGGYHFLHIPEKTHFAIMICVRRDVAARTSGYVKLSGEGGEIYRSQFLTPLTNIGPLFC